MSEENSEKGDEKFLEVNYERMAADQRKHVEEIQAKVSKEPSDALTNELDRQLDKLRFYENAAAGDPRFRAIKAAVTAKQSVMNRAMI